MQNILKFLWHKSFVRDIYWKRKSQKIQAKKDADISRLQTYGMDVLARFDKVLTENGFRYCLAFGTLLGAVREHGFIKHDDDIDVTMWIDDYRQELVDILDRAGFKLKYAFSIDNDKYGKQHTFIYDGILIDIFYIHPSIDKLPYATWNLPQPGCKSWKQSIKKYGGLFVKRIELPYSHDYKRVPFGNLQLPVPVNYDIILSDRYGSDYMTPRKNYCPCNDCIVDWPEKPASFQEF